MQYFLQEVAKDVYTRYKDHFNEICLVFPNQRAGLYFSQYLAKNLDKPIWTPEVFTISDLMQQLSGLKLADSLMLIFDMHQLFNAEKGHKEPFDEFYSWGEMLLHDFDDIDKYLVNPGDLFQNLATIKSMEDQFSYLTEEQLKAIRRFWDTIQMNNLSDQQKDFLNVWEILYKVYSRLNQLLEKRQYAYEGKVYRKVHDLIKSNRLQETKKKYIFIGFNALTPCEKTLFHYLKNQELAAFYWDYDPYYLETHEAGQFIRENMKEFPGNLEMSKSTMTKKKKIRFLNTSYDIAQAKILPELLADSRIPANNPNHTAVVLPDEHLLLPVVSSLPDELEGVNVTMGYPVSVTPAYSLLLALIQLQQNARRETNGAAFYHKDVLAILNHQYIGLIRDDNTKTLIDRIKKHNKVYVGEAELRSSTFMQKIFILPEDYQSLSDYLLENYHHFYQVLKQRGAEQMSVTMELECIYYVYLTIKRLKEIFKDRDVDVKTETYLRILERIVENQNIPYEGEPLSGLQIMGILETRALDFDHLVLLSMNEGIFPKADATPSFIPYSLRKGFGLPTYEHNDAIYAYYFYRMIQRAKQVTLVYNSGADGIQTGEMSRFMQQLKYESDFQITERTIVSGISTPEVSEIRVQKGPEILQKLEEFNSYKSEARTLSPSALNKFLACPLQFYFRYLAGLKEPEEITEDVDLPLFGSILHKALELLYKPYVNAEVTRDELFRITKNDALIEKHLLNAFRTEYFTDVPEDKPLELSGKNILIKEIIHKYIKQFLMKDQMFAPFTVRSLEETYASDIEFEVDNETRKITFSGIIDRLDENKDGVRVIDYKTGKKEQSFRNMEQLFDPKGNHKVLQALIYSRMYAATAGDNKDIIPGLYFIRDLFNNGFHYTLKMDKKPITYQQVANELEDYLKETLQNLFDPEQDFYQTEDPEICRNCPYKNICRR